MCFGRFIGAITQRRDKHLSGNYMKISDKLNKDLLDLVLSTDLRAIPTRISNKLDCTVLNHQICLGHTKDEETRIRLRKKTNMSLICFWRCFRAAGISRGCVRKVPLKGLDKADVSGGIGSAIGAHLSSAAKKEVGRGREAAPAL